MASAGGSTNLIRERSDGEILPPLRAVDQALVVVWDNWDVDYTKFYRKMTILPDIDPVGEYRAPIGVIMAAEDVPDPLEHLDPLILLSHMRLHHQRLPEEPPVDFPEGEEVEEAESDEDEGDVGSASASVVLPSKVTEGNVATLGLADKGAGADLEFCSVVEPHVPAAGPAKQ